MGGTTIFSAWTTETSGLLRELTQVGGCALSAEWLAWLLSELLAEAARLPQVDESPLRYCYLIVEKNRAPYGYVQFAAGANGRLLVEAASNGSLGEYGTLTPTDQGVLAGMGWRPPTCAIPMPDRPTFDNPNFYARYKPPIPIGRVTLLAARTLQDIFDAKTVDELSFRYFDWWHDVPTTHDRLPVGTKS
jgi:hypothetical protein